MKKLVRTHQLLESLFPASCRPSKRTIHRWAQDGVIPSVRIKNRLYFQPDRVERVLEGLEKK